MLLNILVIGGGGREHAIIEKLKQSKRVGKLFAAPGNGGIASDATCVAIKANDIDGMVSFAKENKIDIAVIAPDEPLVMGMVDAFHKVGIKAFGPNKAAAILEGSKVFSKELMKQYHIPTAGYETFDDPQKAIQYVKIQNTYPTVIKADGLALGKGVIIADNYKTAKAGILSIMQDKLFGESGNHVVIEEFLTGPEVSVLAFCDSKTIVPMVSAMDHKRALDNDLGPNTGGMGTIAPNPFFTKEVLEECTKTIFIPTMEAMNKEGRPFKGVIFFGLMITPTGTKVIEYNCRFGDPETQVVLPLLETDLLDILEAVVDERLADMNISFQNKSAACVIMASGGYPGQYQTGVAIKGLDENGQLDGATIYHAGTKFDGEFQTAGGRVLGVTTLGDNLKEAIDHSYQAVSSISFANAQYRTDIGKKALT